MLDSAYKLLLEETVYPFTLNSEPVYSIVAVLPVMFTETARGVMLSAPSTVVAAAY